MSKIHPELTRWQFVMKLDEEARRAEPWKFPPRNPYIFTVEEVAGILHCSIDQVRRIARDQLAPRQGPGKRAIYIQEDVLRFAQQLAVRGGRKFAPLPSEEPGVRPYRRWSLLSLSTSMRRLRGLESEVSEP